jgi:hypothetical protein
MLLLKEADAAQERLGPLARGIEPKLKRGILAFQLERSFRRQSPVRGQIIDGLETGFGT